MHCSGILSKPVPRWKRYEHAKKESLRGIELMSELDNNSYVYKEDGMGLVDDHEIYSTVL